MLIWKMTVSHEVANAKEEYSKGCLFIACGWNLYFYEPEFMAITDEQYKAFVSSSKFILHYFDRC